MEPLPHLPDLEDLASAVATLRAELVRATSDPRLDAVAPSKRASAENLVQYLALRRRDLRELQEALAERGLSSLGRCESNALASVDGVLELLSGLTGMDVAPASPPIEAAEAHALLAERTRALLGPPRCERDVRIMVTLPAEAARRPALARDLLVAGMDVARINCGRDEAAAWTAMARRVREAVEVTGRPCRVLMDLGGPKLRTGAIAPGPQVLRLRPARDEYGRAVAPGRLWLTAAEAPVPPPSPAPVVPVPGQWLERLRDGTVLRLRDTRDSRRLIEVRDGDSAGRWAIAPDTTYLATGTVLVPEGAPGAAAQVGPLPAREGRIRLCIGDRLVLTRSAAPGRGARDGEPARVPCTLSDVFGAVRTGERLFIDDGRFGGRVVRADAAELEIELDSAPPDGGWLREGRGINLPDTDLAIGALTAKDREDIALVARHADLAGLSFVADPEDVLLARELLDDAGGHDVGLVLKIETVAAFGALPDLLLAAMRSEAPDGVMIARGDLAVEAGYERLAEVQEEILWLCEAAHVPAIWATEVLDRMAKTGRPSRAEISDAAMAERAECVMLNKGPNVVEAVATLDDILRRMADHQRKKFSLLRPLRAFETPV